MPLPCPSEEFILWWNNKSFCSNRRVKKKKNPQCFFFIKICKRFFFYRQRSCSPRDKFRFLKKDDTVGKCPCPETRCGYQMWQVYSPKRCSWWLVFVCRLSLLVASFSGVADTVPSIKRLSSLGFHRKTVLRARQDARLYGKLKICPERWPLSHVWYWGPPSVVGRVEAVCPR